MPEPDRLRRGKKFQEIVRKHFLDYEKNLSVIFEQNVSFGDMEHIKGVRGRIDIYLKEEGSEFIVIYEVKATDWNKIKLQNIKKNVNRHNEQLYKYTNTYSHKFNLWACVGLLYPEPTKDNAIRNLIEEHSLEKYGVPVYWLNEIDLTFDVSMLEDT